MTYVFVTSFLNLLCYCLYWSCCLILRNSHLKVLLIFCNYVNVFFNVCFFLLFESLFDCGFLYSFLLLIIFKYDVLLVLFSSTPCFSIMFVYIRSVLYLDDVLICFDLWVGVAILLLFLLM